MTAPLVTLSRAVWRKLVTQATGHVIEGGGLLVGRRVRGGGIHVVEEVGLTHTQATAYNIWYDRDEVAHARKMAYEMYGPTYEPLGTWHTHPRSACTALALEPQITTEGPGADLDSMLKNEIEIICSTFPDPGCTPKHSELEIQRKLGGIWCRTEAWIRINGEAKPCRITVR